MSHAPTVSSRLARRGLFITVALLGLGLIATAWTSYRGAESLAETVSQGQAERLLAIVRVEGPRRGEQPTSAAFASLIPDHAGEGLRAVALLDPSGRIMASAGVLSSVPLSEEELGPGRAFRRLGDRMRVVAPGPPPQPRPPPPEMDWLSPPPPPPSGPGAPRMVLEFEPSLAGELETRATRTLLASVAAAVVLVGAAAIFARRARRADDLMERLAQSERLAALGTMSAVLAHEIKNPLAALKGNAQLLVEGLDAGTRQRTQADRVVSGALRLQGLVDNLLDFARSGGLDRAPLDPAELLCAAAEDASPRAVLDLDAAPAAWSLDAVRLRQVLENLLRNAEQASPGEVTASVRVDGERLIFTVSDRGAGIADGETERIFEPFHTTKTRGVGLGLTVARRVVELHGGTITAKNRPDGGAVLEIEIPRSV
ncbi:MAG: HAMP domain-containing sensor histidine kinase [Byssovorax sp.]